MPNSENSGAVSFIRKVRPNSMTMRKIRASDKPICRARLACFGAQRDTRMEMKTMLSMPSTISSTVRVTSAAQACGSRRSSSMAVTMAAIYDGRRSGNSPNPRK